MPDISKENNAFKMSDADYPVVQHQVLERKGLFAITLIGEETLKLCRCTMSKQDRSIKLTI